MANTDKASGFKPIGHLVMPTGLIQAHEYTLTAGATVYQGDVLKIVAAGTVEAAAANIGLAAIGIAAHYKVAPATGVTKIMVYDDPYIIYSVQCDTGTAAAITDIGRGADHVAGSGSATTKLSGHELDSSEMAAGTGLQFMVIGLVDEPGNAWGEHAKVRVIFNEHLYRAAGASV